MTGDQRSVRPKGGIKGDTRRAERLAAELRANLARRKQRARALRDADTATTDPKSDEPPTDDS